MSAISLGSKNVSGSLLAGNVGFATAYQHIQSITVGSLGASSVTFSEIPQYYRHLQIRGVARDNRASNLDNTYFQVNNDSGSNYSFHILRGDGASAASNGYATQSLTDVLLIASGNDTANIFGAFVVDILDYANTVKYKTVRSLTGTDTNGAGSIRFYSVLWQNTAAINSLKFTAAGFSSFVQHSTFSLYGVR